MRRSPIINNRWTGPRWSQCFGHIGRLFLWGAFIASLKPNIDRSMHTPFSFQPRQNLRCVLHEWLKLLYLLVVLAETWYDLETDREYIYGYRELANPLQPDHSSPNFKNIRSWGLALPYCIGWEDQEACRSEPATLHSQSWSVIASWNWNGKDNYPT